MENIVGLKESELLGKTPPFPWWPDRFKTKYMPIFKEDMKYGCSARELLFVNNMDKEFWIETYDKPIFSEGELKYLIINWFDITGHKLMENDLKESYIRLKNTLQSTINALGNIVEKRDPYTSGHQKRVSKLAVAISEELGLGSGIIDCIKTASDIHDIGKINIPVSILTKPGKLTDIEFRMIKTHSEVGYEIVKEIEFQMPVAEIILEHHEKLDGSGYPRGLKDEDIMFESKILTVADVVEAMSSDRPYRPALGVDVAIDEIKKNRGRLYDPRVVDACISVLVKRGFKFD
jgi:putative nucleotidyltransferase with HDIG domain/PAS domain S-box-containing protein